MTIEYNASLLPAIVILVSVVFVLWYRSGKRVVPTNWPVVGMFPSLFVNRSQVHDFFTKLLEQGGGTFELKGSSWFATDFLLTSDPENVHYVLSKNFSNFSKGPHFTEYFSDVLGNGIFTADSKSWEDQRKAAMLVLNHHEFQKFVGKKSWEKVEKGLIPILDHVLETDSIIDLQDLFKRFTFDTTSILVLGHDPALLTVDLPQTAILGAFTDLEEAVYYRHLLPEFVWKFQRWFQIGREKKHGKGKVALHKFINECTSLKKLQEQKPESSDMLSSYIINGVSATDQSLKDTLLNMLFAGTDTISSALAWFFYILAENPEEEMKIRREINDTITNENDLKNLLLSNNCKTDKVLTYLHGALCESLRLFPPIPLQHKSPIIADVLPSGHRVEPNSMTLLCLHSMGRMESIWGKNCSEFKPERWMAGSGKGVKHEPSYKFPAFNAGPRSCIGKETSFRQLKLVITTLLYRYKFNPIKPHPPVIHNESIVLHMKHGLMVTVTPASN